VGMRTLVGLGAVAVISWVSAAGCTRPEEVVDQRRPIWKQKLATIEALAGKVAGLGPEERGDPPAAPLELILATTGRVSNGTIVDLRQLDPAWKAERIDYRYPFRSFELEACRRMIAPMDPGRPLDDRFLQAFREHERWLLGLRYVVVAREDEYIEPTLSGERFVPGLIRTSAFLFQVDGAKLLGRWELSSTISKDVIRTVYTKTDKQEMVLRQYQSEQAKADLLQALAQQHKVSDWLGIPVRKR